MEANVKRRKVDRWATYNYFHDQVINKYGLKPIDIAIWHALFRHADIWGIIKLSNSRICSESGITNKRTLKRSLEKMVELKLIGMVQKGGSGNENRRQCTVWWQRSKRQNG